MNIFWFIGNTN